MIRRLDTFRGICHDEESRSMQKLAAKREKTMPLPLETVFEAALELPEKERLALAFRLLETTPVEDLTISLADQSFLAELERRFADRGGEIDWSELRAERQADRD
jgi:hypothetical protein